MIINQRQYALARKQLLRLRNIRLYNFTPEKVRQKYGVEALEESILALEEQISRYLDLCYGKVRVELDVIDTVPDLLIMARISSGLTQKDLAKRMGTSRQHVTRLEKTRYSGASFKLIAKAKQALELANSKT